MRRKDIPADISGLAFDFFYWFSRFEFALKEHDYLRSKSPGSKAEVDWTSFIKVWKEKYTPSQAAKDLIAANPLRQVVDQSVSGLINDLS